MSTDVALALMAVVSAAFVLVSVIAWQEFGRWRRG